MRFIVIFHIGAKNFPRCFGSVWFGCYSFLSFSDVPFPSICRNNFQWIRSFKLFYYTALSLHLFSSISIWRWAEQTISILSLVCTSACVFNATHHTHGTRSWCAVVVPFLLYKCCTLCMFVLVAQPAVSRLSRFGLGSLRRIAFAAAWSTTHTSPHRNCIHDFTCTCVRLEKKEIENNKPCELWCWALAHTTFNSVECVLFLAAQFFFLYTDLYFPRFRSTVKSSASEKKNPSTHEQWTNERTGEQRKNDCEATARNMCKYSIWRKK